MTPLFQIVSEYEKQFASSTEIHVITSLASSHQEAAEFCEVTYGGSLIDSNDVNLLYNDVNARQFKDMIGDDINLFWTKQHIDGTGQGLLYRKYIFKYISNVSNLIPIFSDICTTWYDIQINMTSKG